MLKIGDVENILEGYSSLDDDETKEICIPGSKLTH
jgi:hypothetical protein